MDTNSADTSFAFDLNKCSDDEDRESEGTEVIGDGNESLLEKEEPDVLKHKLKRMRSKNKKLVEMISYMFENYSTLQGHLVQLVQGNSGDGLLPRKRKFEVENCINPLGDDTCYDSISDEGSPKRPREIRTNISTFYVRVDPSDTSLVVKDGYHWRKYGQKVTKDNPSPRAYYKCSFAPSCPVKKKVQRSVGDPAILVATYEGEHNHPNPSRPAMLMSSPQDAAAVLSPSPKCFENHSSPKKRVDFIDSGSVSDSFQRSLGSNAIQQLMVEQMASSLISNPNFTAAIAAAISERMVNHDSKEN